MSFRSEFSVNIMKGGEHKMPKGSRVHTFQQNRIKKGFGKGTGKDDYTHKNLPFQSSSNFKVAS